MAIFIGRLDVAYKSVLRLFGAAAGTAIALLFTVHLGSHDEAPVVLILAAIFLGTWLRPAGYAWWALFVTLALALLQGFTGFAPQNVLWLRLQEIAIGAIIGVAAAWFVLPVRSTAVMRRRIADALASLADGLDPAKNARTSNDFIAAVARADQVAPAFRASRWMTKTFQRVQPAEWVDTLASCRELAATIIDAGETPGSVRRAVGAARKAIRDPSARSTALNNVLQSLTGHSSTKDHRRAQSDG
ncbi:MAG: FUSC family protein [Dokdonella sp.]